ncbi:hypothetical protein [Nonomuraea sp. NPDC003804]|uniref:hypothetical protein n=1 Tax=Nonomuraea sp. NPDC003804 TaxID=3154547 RepID=UPI0033B2153B
MTTKQSLAEETTREEPEADISGAETARPDVPEAGPSTTDAPKAGVPEGAATPKAQTQEAQTPEAQTPGAQTPGAQTLAAPASRTNGPEAEGSEAVDPPPVASKTASTAAGDANGDATGDATGDAARETGDGGAGRTGGGRGARWRGVAIGAVLALVLATAGATAVLQWISAGRLQDRLAPLEHDRLLRLEVSGAAGAFATTLLSYDYKDLQTTRGKVIAMTAGDFLATYDEAFGGPMEQVIVKLEAVSKATVREVYLSELDDASAKALVSVDQQVTSKEAVRNVLGTHLKLVMIKQKGVWKVSDVTVLGAAKETETKLDKKG